MSAQKNWSYSYSIDASGTLRIFTPGNMLISEISGCGKKTQEELYDVAVKVVSDYKKQQGRN